MSRAGFSLAEVVAALLVLEVGVLGTAGLVVLAARERSRAVRMERRTVLLAEVADSLAQAGLRGGGERPGPGGTVRWVDAGGTEQAAVRIEAVDSAGSVLLDLWTAVPRAEPEETAEAGGGG